MVIPQVGQGRPYLCSNPQGSTHLSTSILPAAANANTPNKMATAKKTPAAVTRCRKDARWGISRLFNCWFVCIIMLEYCNVAITSRFRERQDMVLEQQSLNQMLETAIVAARLAGRHAMEEIAHLKVSVKNNTELVTSADIQCQKIIVDQIKDTYPDHGFIAEEGEQGKIFKQLPRGSESIWWAIDPIDGTHNFAHQMLLFTISIAAIYQGQPVVGVIFEPATDSMFTAVKGGQAQLNGRTIVAGEETIHEFSSVGLDSHFENGVPGWACQILRKTRFRNLGTTALQIAYVAKGSLTGTIIACPRLWDIAAGQIIIEAAGAIMTDWQGGKVFPLDLANYEGQEFQVIAANKKVHLELIRLLKS